MGFRGFAQTPLPALFSNTVVRIFRGSADFSVFLDLVSSVIFLKSAFTATVFEMFSGFC